MVATKSLDRCQPEGEKEEGRGVKGNGGGLKADPRPGLTTGRSSSWRQPLWMRNGEERRQLFTPPLPQPAVNEAVREQGRRLPAKSKRKWKPSPPAFLDTVLGAGESDLLNLASRGNPSLNYIS